MYRIHHAQDGQVGDRNFADLAGEASYICTALDAEDRDLIITEYEVRACDSLNLWTQCREPPAQCLKEIIH